VKAAPTWPGGFQLRTRSVAARAADNGALHPFPRSSPLMWGYGACVPS